ncbi:hypothetical protein BVI434_100017 [Burkholderia vietnamiensis]|nr:hypothetical protein BVI434_100017 [Burkholderia vietnamiensis]
MRRGGQSDVRGPGMQCGQDQSLGSAAQIDGNGTHVVDRTHIGPENQCIVAKLGLHTLECSDIATGHRDPSAFCNKELRGRETDSASAAGNQS